MISDQIIDFFRELNPPKINTPGVEVLNPYTNSDTLKIVEQFYSKYYSDNNKRLALVGINPGRFGAGLTGIGFTDPKNLKEICNIENPFPQKHELSSRFIYDVIDAYGGSDVFFKHIYIASVVPLGFVKEGINLNYYDIKSLEKELVPYIKSAWEKQLPFLDRRVAFCVGKGKNQKFLEKLNREEGYFEKIEVLPHPRWIMQYKLKMKNHFIEQYLHVLSDFTAYPIGK